MSPSTDAVERPFEVLDPGQLSLRELATQASLEHGLVLQAGASMVEHAIRAGEALLEAQRRVSQGGWLAWVAENVEFVHWRTAYKYMRLATYKHELSDKESIASALVHLAEVGAPGRDTGISQRKPTWMRDEAAWLKAEGMPIQSIAQSLQVSRNTIRRWLDPAYDERQQRSANDLRKRQRAAREALRREEREQAIKRAVRKAGAATQEAWAMAERMQDVIAQAQRETEDVTARRHLSEAGVHYRKMRDEIVRALGVS